MKIKTRLRINSTIVTVLMLAMVLLFLQYRQQALRNDQDLSLVEEMRKIAFERTELRDEYLANRSERAKMVWEKKTEYFRLLLEKAKDAFPRPADRKTIEAIEDAYQGTINLFYQLAERREGPGNAQRNRILFYEGQQRLMSQILVKVHVLMDHLDALRKSMKEAADTAHHNLHLLFILCVAVAVFITIGNSVFLNNLLAGRIGVLRKGTEIIGEGNLEHRIGAAGNDELADLARKVNDMAKKLRESYTSVENLNKEIAERKRVTATLKQSEERYRSLFMNMLNGFAYCRMLYLEGRPCDFIYLDVNKAFSALTGLDNVVGKRVSEVIPGIQEADPQLFEIYGRVALTGKPEIFETYVESLQDWYSISVYSTEKGHFIAVFDVITERKRSEENILRLNRELEQRVLDRTAQLAVSNKELESFAYSVSHDLRAPLRGIDGWSLALIEDYGERLDEQARVYLDRVRMETQRMGLLIDDLLKLSRVTRAEMRLLPVDLTSLASEIADKLQKEWPERRIEFIIQPGLRADGDGPLLEIALTNLLDNAVKFTGKKALARIEFGGTAVDGGRAFFVRDNGAGFDMAYAQKLFGAFQRLHKTSEFPGTGIGLATVQRIIHRHGGRVWAEAERDQGATFYFTLESVA